MVATTLRQALKDRLVNWGSSNQLTRAALRLSLASSGFAVRFQSDKISITKNKQTICLRAEDLSFVPEIAQLHEHLFAALVPEQRPEGNVLDFSLPGLRKYRRTGLEMLEPGIPEDDAMPYYCRWFTPEEGMRVFDVGAHAGLTTLELSRMVGFSGKVVAFEPDNGARGYLQQNLERYAVENAEVVPIAIGESTGEALFSMDGTQAAGFVETIVYARPTSMCMVPVLSLADAVARYGMPTFIKMDIEGAELPLIRGALPFLRDNPVALAMETHRLRDGTFTHDPIVAMLRGIGYQAEHVVLGTTRQSFVFARAVQLAG